jgi:hypothetical protein
VATDIYDPDLEYSPMLQGYFDLMSISRSLDLHGRTKEIDRYSVQGLIL